MLRLFGFKGYRFLADVYHFFLNIFFSFLPMNDEILLESHPDLTCNTWPLFQYMLKEKLNEKIRITWMVNDPQKYKHKYDHLKNISFMEIKPQGLWHSLKKYLRCNRAKCIITSNRFVSKKYVGRKQLNIYLDHGSPLKDCKEIYKMENFSCDYYIAQGSFFIEAIMDQYNLSKGQVICLGLPKNDELFSKINNIERLYNDVLKFDKIIIWVPTFREHMNKTRIDVNTHFPLGIPILYTEQDVRSLNLFLDNKNVLLIIKPHPAQDLSVLKDYNVSNIRFLYNRDLEVSNIQTNELLAQTDAMIGDYSSIYWDYLLLNKPIGITLDDYEQYKAQMGFAFNKPLDVLIGEYIYNTKDLINFIKNVSDNIDIKQKDREKYLREVQVEPRDGSTKRLYDFICQKLEL